MQNNIAEYGCVIGHQTTTTRQIQQKSLKVIYFVVAPYLVCLVAV